MVSKDRRTPDIFGCWILGWTYTAQLEFNTESLQQIGSSKEGCPIATMAWDQAPGIQAASRFDGRVLLSKYTTQVSVCCCTMGEYELAGFDGGHTWHWKKLALASHAKWNKWNFIFHGVLANL